MVSGFRNVAFSFGLRILGFRVQGGLRFGVLGFREFRRFRVSGS